MGLRVNGFQLLDAHLGVNGRGLIRSRLTAAHPSGSASLRPKRLQAFGVFQVFGDLLSAG
jgi:hypothetical protein